MGMIYWLKDNGLVMRTNDRPETIAYCESMGWTLTDDPKKEIKKEVQEEVEPQPMINADKGSGVFNSPEYHESAIIGMENQEEIRDYMKELGFTLDVRGNLKKTRKQALNIIRSQDDNSNSNN